MSILDDICEEVEHFLEQRNLPYPQTKEELETIKERMRAIGLL
jgi:hypothetical protein